MSRYIDADKLKELIRQEPTDGMFTNEILAAIDEQPSADVRPERHGYWVYHRDIHGISYFCSNCTCGVSDTGTESYCHYCGAKIDKEEGENNQ